MAELDSIDVSSRRSTVKSKHGNYGMKGSKGKKSFVATPASFTSSKGMKK